MRIIISPAKKMNADTDSLPWKDHPIFLEKATELRSVLQEMTAEELKKMTDQLDIAGVINNTWLNTIVTCINFSAISNILWILSLATIEIPPLSLAFSSLALLADSEKAQQKIMQFILKNKTEVPHWMLKKIAKSVTDPKKCAKLETDSSRKSANTMKSHGVLKNEFNTCVSLADLVESHIKNITGFIGGFKEYSSIVGIFGEDMGPAGDPGRLNTMVGYIYDSLPKMNYGQASAAALILFAIIFVVTIFNNSVIKKHVHY